ncbi:MAG: ATP-binding cassette domain-containing protein [Alphaproteobacteria bacterium]
MIVAVDGLTKRFTRKGQQPFTAVDEVSFSIAPGERVAFIGPNGAGKSTTLKMLTGILFPSGGTAQVAGHVPWAERQALALRIGVVFGQRSQLWYHLPAQDSFDLIARMYAIPQADYRWRLDHVVEVLKIGHLIGQPVKSLSLGQRMRCEIAGSLLHGPSVLFLDEPTIGLDVTAKALLREHLKHLAQAEDTTIVLTSHDTGDIEEICDRVILINDGRILLDRPLEALRADFLTAKQVVLVTDEEAPHLTLGADMPGVELTARDRHRLTLRVDTKHSRVDRVVAQALETLSVRDLSIEAAPLESIILRLYGERQ